MFITLTTKTKQQFLQHTSKFFVQGDKLWQQELHGQHQQVVVKQSMQYQLLKEVHD